MVDNCRRINPKEEFETKLYVLCYLCIGKYKDRIVWIINQ